MSGKNLILRKFDILKVKFILGTVYNLGVSEGDYTDWEFMFEQYKKELVADEKVRYYVKICK